MKNKILIILIILLVPLNSFSLDKLTEEKINTIIHETTDFNDEVIKISSRYKHLFPEYDYKDNDDFYFKILEELSIHLFNATLLFNHVNVMFIYLSENYLDNLQYQYALETYVDSLIHIESEVSKISNLSNNKIIKNYCIDLILLLSPRVEQCKKIMSL